MINHDLLVLVLIEVVAASVDYETDHRIQHTIAKAFRDRTILCIARASPKFNPLTTLMIIAI